MDGGAVGVEFKGYLVRWGGGWGDGVVAWLGWEREGRKVERGEGREEGRVRPYDVLFRGRMGRNSEMLVERVKEYGVGGGRLRMAVKRIERRNM